MSPTNKLFTALRSVFVGFGALTALVGMKVSRGAARQGEGLPLLTIHLLSGERDETHSGEGAERSARLQFDCDSLTQAQADEIAEAVGSALRHALTLTNQQVYFLGVSYEDENEQHFTGASPTKQGAEEYFRKSVIYKITFKTA